MPSASPASASGSSPSAGFRPSAGSVGALGARIGGDSTRGCGPGELTRAGPGAGCEIAPTSTARRGSGALAGAGGELGAGALGRGGGVGRLGGLVPLLRVGGPFR